MVHAAETLAGPSIETLEAMLDVTYTWGYQDTREKLRDLYDKAVRAQWISDEVLPWDTDVDLELPMGPEQLLPLFGSEIWDRMTPAERVVCNGETSAWTLSQFLHGEQGALLATAQLVDSVTDLDSKLYAASARPSTMICMPRNFMSQRLSLRIMSSSVFRCGFTGYENPTLWCR